MQKAMQKIILEIKKELRKNIDEKYKKGAQNFFKEEVKIIGVRIPVVRKISAKHFTSWSRQNLPSDSAEDSYVKKEIFNLCEKLLKAGSNEEVTIAFDWAFRLKKQFEKSDFNVFEKWLKKYVSNWASCDDFCGHAFGELFFQFPELFNQTKKWAKSKNRWLRRASAVILIYPVRKILHNLPQDKICNFSENRVSRSTRTFSNGVYSIRRKNVLKNIFKIADILLVDIDDMVQKGYGWMLKEASNIYPNEVFKYVMKNKKKMPRTALRYAIEKMPKEWRQKAIER